MTECHDWPSRKAFLLDFDIVASKILEDAARAIPMTECPDWFIEAFGDHVNISAIINWNREIPDFSEPAQKLWGLIQRRQYEGNTQVCPVGRKEGRGHALTWQERTDYGNPNQGGLWSCYDCGGKLYTLMDGDPVEWTGP